MLCFRCTCIYCPLSHQYEAEPIVSAFAPRFFSRKEGKNPSTPVLKKSLVFNKLQGTGHVYFNVALMDPVKTAMSSKPPPIFEVTLMEIKFPSLSFFKVAFVTSRKTGPSYGSPPLSSSMVKVP